MSNDKQWSPDDAVAREVREFDRNREAMIGGNISDEEFRQFRLERGVYGQRQPGVQMVRVKIPYGGLTPHQLKCLAEMSSKFGHGIVHLTTRQDVQIHYVRLGDITKIMDLLAEADITTREACGNTVRNVTACPFAGVCRDEVFDVTSYAHRTTQHLMRNPSTAGLGRKFKVSFSGCESSCGLTAMHDIGLTAATRVENGTEQRGFRVVVGGGLGAAPKSAELLYDFIPEGRLLPLCEAITRVFFINGERDRRMRARMKFLVQDIGIDEFRKLVENELKGLPETLAIEPLAEIEPVRHGESSSGQGEEPDSRWFATNVYAQKQPGFVAVIVRLPLGDIAADRLSSLADLVADFSPDTRITVEQNFLLRWVDESRLPSLYAGLKALDLVQAGAGRLIDATVCPGADTCNLGITSSKGLARAFSDEMESTLARFADHDIRIKISGCPNSCGQHHIADIGFYGCSLKVNGRVAPAFQMLLGGRIDGSGATFAEPIAKLASRKLPAVLGALLEHFESEKRNGDSFHDYVNRVGTDAILAHLTPFGAVDPQNPGDVFQDWGGHSNFALKVGKGECAGEQVDMVDALIGRAKSHLVDARGYHDKQEYDHAAYSAYSGIIQAVKSYIIAEGVHATSYHQIITEFEQRRNNMNGMSATFTDFKTRLEEFKSSVPGESVSMRYLAFADEVFGALENWATNR